MVPAVTVVITCYNYGHFLADCLESVLNQTFQGFEILLIDDGSTDHTADVAARYSGDPRLKYIRQANQGQARAKNRGIQNAQGDLVAFLDADDLWESEKLEKQVALFGDDQVGVVYSRARYIDAHGADLNRAIESFGVHLTPRRGHVLPYMLFDNFVPFSSAMVRRDLLGQGFNEELKMAIDWEMWLYLSLDWKFDFVDESLITYRMGHSGQMSHNVDERFRCADGILEQFLKNHTHRLEKGFINDLFAHKYYLRWIYYFEREPARAREFLKKAVGYKVDLLLIVKTLARRWLGPFRAKG
ncbi:glycosyltransferase [Desulfocicer niacini]